MPFKPGDHVTYARETGTHDWTTPVFSDEPYVATGLVMQVSPDGKVVYVWWNGTNVFNSHHAPEELRLIRH